MSDCSPAKIGCCATKLFVGVVDVCVVVLFSFVIFLFHPEKMMQSLVIVFAGK